MRCAAASCLLLLGACQHLEDPASATAPRVVVHAVLNAGSSEQIILVSRARTGISVATGGIGDDEPIVGAVVTVTAPNGIVMVASGTDPQCNCAPGAYGFSPFRSGVDLYQSDTYTYRLNVVTPAGEEVSGTTTVPADTSHVTNFPPRTLFRERDTLRLAWPRVPGARSYEVVIGASRTGEYRIFTDTSIAIPGTALTIDGDEVFPLGTVDVIVSAVDANYYDYYRAQSDPFAGASPSHLNGAVGVFGSIVPLLVGELQVR